MNKQSALFLLRKLRAESPRFPAGFRRVDIAAPDPSPGKHLTHGALRRLFIELGFPETCESFFLAMPSGKGRVKARGVRCTTYEKGIPPESFIEAGNGMVISGPELLFTELADSMHPLEHLMLGHELCGTFSRDPGNPYNGPVAFGVRPLTTAERIRDFTRRARGIRGIGAARETARFLDDNAWSPTESLIAAMLRLPVDSLGYGFGDLVLNPRVDKASALPGARESRVPDIMISGTTAGVNYDGLVHLDLQSIVRAAVDVGAHPGSAENARILQGAIREVRIKAVDDVRRNRELSTRGLSVLPVLMEDLYTPGGMDSIAAHLVSAIEGRGERDMSEVKRHFGKRALSDARYRKMLSLLPGSHERNVEVGRFIQGFRVADGPGTVVECVVEF